MRTPNNPMLYQIGAMDWGTEGNLCTDLAFGSLDCRTRSMVIQVFDHREYMGLGKRAVSTTAD